MLGAVAVTFLVQRFAPEAKGRGVPEVIDAIYCKGGRIRPAVAATKALASSISIGTGGAVVRGGRIIQIGSAMIIVVSVAYYVRQFLTADTSYTFKLSQRRHPVPVSGDSSVHAVQGRGLSRSPVVRVGNTPYMAEIRRRFARFGRQPNVLVLEADRHIRAIFSARRHYRLTRRARLRSWVDEHMETNYIGSPPIWSSISSAGCARRAAKW